MAKAANKTVPGKLTVSAFVAGIRDAGVKKDVRELMKMMRSVSGKRPVMWGTSIVGYGKYQYQYASGREGEWPKTGFSPRARSLSVYIMPGFEPFKHHLKQLGKHKTSKSCLYLNRLDDIDMAVLEALVRDAYSLMSERYGAD